MKILQIVLAGLIRSGKVTVEIPNLDMDKLLASIRSEAMETLREIEGIVYEEEITDAEKVAWIQELLEKNAAHIL